AAFHGLKLILKMFSACFPAPPCLRVKRHPPTPRDPGPSEIDRLASRLVRAIADGGCEPHRNSVERESPDAEFPRYHQGNESLPARVPAYPLPVSETFSSDSDQYADSNRPAKPQGLVHCTVSSHSRHSRSSSSLQLFRPRI